MEPYILQLKQSEKNINIAEHILYTTLKIINDKKLLLRALEAIYSGIKGIINACLQYDYIMKRAELYKDPKDNFEQFLNKSAGLHNIDKKDCKEIVEFFSIIEAHIKSPMEFMRKERIILMSSDLSHVSLDEKKLKYFLQFTKNILRKSKNSISP